MKGRSFREEQLFGLNTDDFELEPKKKKNLHQVWDIFIKKKLLHSEALRDKSAKKSKNNVFVAHFIDIYTPPFLFGASVEPFQGNYKNILIQYKVIKWNV